ncbi:MAG TPA: hypothetical protein VI731_03935, partial [Bacteroidia bacterium]|nr:hypothetical protein [Bacteroidia bacterium]
MKKKLFSIVILATALPAGAQTVVANALVPQFIQGNAGTNNDRTPFWFWAELTGLTPGATYRFYTAMDSLNASASSNGAGNPYLINQTGNTIRRTTNPSFSNAANYDSLTAGNSGTASHWFGVEPTGNGRYTPGNTLFAKIMLNDGQGGTTVSERVLLALHPVTVIDYGTVPGDSAQGSGFYDSTGALANNFICIYDNPLAIGRPINIAIVENDGMDLYNLSVIVNFYANTVDTSAGRWGSIIPNNLPNGIRSIEERSFNGATPVDTVADMDGTWCSGVNTVNQGHGSSAVNLNSTFVLTGLANMPDSTWTGLPTTFSASS